MLRKMLNKKSLLICCLIVSLLVSITSCSKTGDKETKTSFDEDIKLTYPIQSDKPIKLRFWTEMHGAAAKFISSYNENWAYKKIQEETGIQIEFIHPTLGSEQEQFNIMIAGGDLPDIMHGGNRYKGGIVQGVKDGIFLDLTDYIEKYAPDYYKIVTSDENLLREVTTDDNRFYSIDCVMKPGDPIAPPWFRPNIRKDWLDEFGMDIPQTLDEVEAYFDAVQKYKGTDVLCVAFPQYGSWHDEIFYQPYNILPNFFVVDGKVKYGKIEPALKDYLQRMNKWYQKGYISKDFLSYDMNQLMGQFQAGKVAMVLDSVDVMYDRAKEANIKVVSLPYFRLKRGDKLHTGPRQSYHGGMEAVVTKDCKYPEIAVHFLNYGFTDKGFLTYNYGIEGVTYNIVDGVPKYTDEIVNPNDMTHEAASYVKAIHFGTKRALSDLVKFESTREPEAIAYRKRWADDPDVDDSYRLPPVKFTTEENSRLTKIMTDLTAYADEMVFKFIMGVEPIEKFDEYIQHCKELGVDEAIQIYQTAYDRYMSK